MTIPRRSYVNLMTPAELAIREAIRVVEEAGADPLLTDAVSLLSDAQTKLADWVDREQAKQPKVNDRNQFLRLIGEVRSNGATPDGPLLAVFDGLQETIAFLGGQLAGMRDHVTFMQANGTTQVNAIRDLKGLLSLAKAELYQPDATMQRPIYYEIEKALR